MNNKKVLPLASDFKHIRLKSVQSDQLDFQQYGFSLGKSIGTGAFATVKTAVYSKPTPNARSLKLACKIIDQTKTSAEYLRKFLPRELEILKKIHHPNIIQVHSIFQRKQKVYIFMQNADYGDLYHFVLQNGPVKESCTRFWFYQIATAIRYLHSINVVHRDLKCENILISRHMNAKVSDFGFAKIVGGDGDGGSSISDAHMQELSKTWCGSVAYAAPEILLNEPYDAKIADVWSLGIILFIMLFAAMPFDDTSYSAMVAAQKARRICVVQNTEVKLSRACKRIFRELLEPDLAYRAKLDDVLKSNWLKKYCSCN